MRMTSLSFRGSAQELRKRGFSLIEVLVAMTILMLIVLIVAGIFQSTSTAWSIGLQRADEQSVTRAVVGAITRDLSMMVDPNNFVIGPAEGDSSIRDQALTAGDLAKATGELSGTLDFWILKATDSIDDDPPTRELAHITYDGGSGSVTRTETTFNASSGDPSSTTTSQFDLGSDGSVSFEVESNAEYDGYTSLYEAAAVRIVVRPTTPTTIDSYEIHVGSRGPDGSWNTDDDIKPWVND